jgi:hypothetical protein
MWRWSSLVWFYIIRLKLKYIIIKKHGRKNKLTASRRVDLARFSECRPLFLNHCSFLCGFRTELKLE